jgi:hypothetical protein
MANEIRNPFNDFILVPEFIIKAVITQALFYINADYNQTITDYNDETKSYLYILTYGLGIERVNVFKQAKSLFIDVVEEKPRISVYLGYPQLVEGAVSVAIVNSGEVQGVQALGVDEATNRNYHEFDYPIDTPPEDQTESNFWRKTYGKRYNASYQIIVTGANTNETVIVYTIIKALMVSLEGTAHLSTFGFQNVKLNSSDVTLKSETVKNQYAKSITLSFEYEFRVPDVIKQKYVNGLIFKGILLDI